MQWLKTNDCDPLTTWQDTTAEPVCSAMPCHLLADMTREGAMEVTEWREEISAGTPMSGMGGKVTKDKKEPVCLWLRVSLFYWFDLTDFLKSIRLWFCSSPEDSPTGDFTNTMPYQFPNRTPSLDVAYLFLPSPTSEALLTLSQFFLWLQLIQRSRRTKKKGNKLIWGRNRVLPLLSHCDPDDQ